MRFVNLITVIWIVCCSSQVAAQQSQPLWKDKAPYQAGDTEKDIPTLTLYLADSAKVTDVGIIICPGGGYGGLAVDHEGKQVAEWLNWHGISAFVLRYRHAPNYKHPVPLTDVQRAIRTVRVNSERWGIASNKIGVLGFSAGGHLTSTAGTMYSDGDPNSADPIEKVSSRPDFLILGYPVITMLNPHTHKGSRRNLLGEEPTPEMMEKMSTHLQVNEQTPPAFLIHTSEDKAVPAQNSLLFYQALIEHRVPAELHIFEKGRHGLGLAQKTLDMKRWPDLCIQWLKTRGFL
jgi:acetyl esterase/lipase